MNSFTRIGQPLASAEYQPMKYLTDLDGVKSFAKWTIPTQLYMVDEYVKWMAEPGSTA